MFGGETDDGRIWRDVEQTPVSNLRGEHMHTQTHTNTMLVYTHETFNTQ